MGSSAADTEREIARLRGDMSAAVAEAQRRFQGGVKTLAGAEARVTSSRTRTEIVQKAKANPPIVGAAGAVVVAAIGYGIYAIVSGRRERQLPRERLKRRAQDVGERVSEVFHLSGAQLEKARQRKLLVKLDPDDGGYMRVLDARLEPIDKNKGLRDLVKKLVWAGLLSVFMAIFSVLARRVAGEVWKATVREEPPTEKAKPPS